MLNSSSSSAPTMEQADTQTRPFTNPDLTLDGQPRARVGLRGLTTLWFNTGTLCNIECTNCYIESSPSNDRLVYLSREDVVPFLDEIEVLGYSTSEIGFTGGEPFMNPEATGLAELCLERGFEVLILTNAMQPMQRPRVKKELLRLNGEYANRLRLRVSIDHYSASLHDEERGAGTFQRTLDGLLWLADHGFNISIAGRMRWDETENELRRGYENLFRQHGIKLDAGDPHDVVLFPEMDQSASVPEITTACWGILGVSPDAMMCANSRMVVKRKSASRPVVLPCTLLPYDPDFEMGASLSEAADVDGDSFEHGKVKLNHPHCAKFCVLGGGACSG
ncbi:MAG TPA: radical SAM protein [Arenicellales bacterium]|nr:radical SAM protein [Arenicellales bacterium]